MLPQNMQISYNVYMHIKINEVNEIQGILSEIYEGFSADIIEVGHGEFTKAFGFNFDGDDLIFKIADGVEQFQKELFAGTNFNSLDVPIPKILRIDSFTNGRFYCISKKCPGEVIDRLSDIDLKLIIPEFTNMSTHLWTSPIKRNGWGLWNRHGDGQFRSWVAFLESESENILSKPNNLDSQKVYKYLHSKMIKYYPQLVDSRYLVHGDYGFNNIFSYKNKISGVIDWGDSMYGDFVYDISWIQLWSSQINHVSNFFKPTLFKNLNFVNFEERLKCYVYFSGMRILNYFDSRSDTKSYNWMLDKLSRFLSDQLGEDQLP